MAHQVNLNKSVCLHCVKSNAYLPQYYFFFAVTSAHATYWKMYVNYALFFNTNSECFLFFVFLIVKTDVSNTDPLCSQEAGHLRWISQALHKVFALFSRQSWIQ